MSSEEPGSSGERFSPLPVGHLSVITVSQHQWLSDHRRAGWLVSNAPPVAVLLTAETHLQSSAPDLGISVALCWYSEYLWKGTIFLVFCSVFP